MPFRSRSGLLAALLFAAALALPPPSARAAAFTDAAGRHVMLPDAIGRILPAERNAEVLVFVLAPNKLAGLERGSARRGAPDDRYLPVIDWTFRSTPAAMATTARQVGADVIIDAGNVTPDRAAFADAVQRLTGIPYILVDDSFSRIPRMLRSIGAMLGVRDRAEDLAVFADHAISGLRGRLLITPSETRPHIYYALGYDGLTTALPGSPAGEAIDEAGAINVASALGQGTETRIAPARLFGWDPPIIIAEHRRFYEALRRDPYLRRLSAVRSGHIYLEPTSPFGWIEDPSGINRLIGLHWLSTLLYPTATQEDLRATVCDFYDKFYRTKLTNAQIEAMVRPAGVPPAEATRYAPEPLIGLGAAPASTLPANSPGAPSAPTRPSAPISAANAPGAAVPGEPSAAPSAVTGVPGLPNTAPTATCAIPTGPNPQPLPGLSSLDNLPPETAPGVPPPGRRGRPTPSPDQPGPMTH